MQVTLLTLLAANAVFASPVYKRQTEVISSVTQAAGSAVAAATATNPISLPVAPTTPDITPTSIMSEVIASVQPEASGMSSMASMVGAIPESADMSASASASSSGADSGVYSLAYPCPDGTQLIYVETQSNVNASLSVVNDAVSYFSNSTLFNITEAMASSDGNQTIGQTRMTSIADVIVPEVLVDFMMDNETDARFLTWNNTQSATIMDILVANYSTQSQSYTNDTLSTEEDPVSTIKVFSNICVGTEMADAAQTFLQGFFTDRVSAAAAGIELAVNPDANNPLSSASSMAESATAVAGSAVQSATSAVESVLESATSAVESVVSSATQAAGAVTSSVASSAASATQAVGGSTSGGPLLINTPPSIVQCRPVALTFTGGQAPYFLSILPGGQPTATPLLQFPQQSAAQTYTWNAVNIAAGTSITIQVRDGSGEVNFSSPVTITDSMDASCLAVPTTSA